MWTWLRGVNPGLIVVLALLSLGGAVLLGFSGLALGIDEPREARPFLIASGVMLLAAFFFVATAVAVFAHRRETAADDLFAQQGPRRRAPLSIAGMLLSLGAIVLLAVPFLSIPLAIAGFTTSLVARRRIVRSPDRLSGKTLANVGIGTALAASVLTVLILSTLYGRVTFP